MDLAKGRWGVEKDNRRRTFRAWINQIAKAPKVRGPSRWTREAAYLDVDKLLAASREDLHRVVSDLKDAAKKKKKKKTCVEKHGPGWRSVVRGWRNVVIALGPVRATQDAASRDVIMAKAWNDKDEDEAVVSTSPEAAQFMQAGLENLQVPGPGELESDDEVVTIPAQLILDGIAGITCDPIITAEAP